MAFRLFLGNVPAGGAPAEITGTLSGTEGADVAALTGDVIVQGSLSGVEGADAPAFVGTVPVQGTLAATDGADSAALTGGVVVQGTLAATEGADSGAFTGGVLVQGELSATEGADTSASTGLVIVQGSAGTTEGADTASLTGGVLVQGTLAATEGADDAALTGVVVAAEVTGTLAATEGADTAALSGVGVVQGASGGGYLFPRRRRPRPPDFTFAEPISNVTGIVDGDLPLPVLEITGRIGIGAVGLVVITPEIEATGELANLGKVVEFPLSARGIVASVGVRGRAVQAVNPAIKSEGRIDLVLSEDELALLFAA